jgi:hypothetical protein
MSNCKNAAGDVNNALHGDGLDGEAVVLEYGPFMN